MTKNACITIVHVQNTTIAHINVFAGDSNTYCNRKGIHAVIPSATNRVKKPLSFHTEQTRVHTAHTFISTRSVTHECIYTCVHTNKS